MAETSGSVKVGFRYGDYTQTALSDPLARRINVPYCAIDGVEYVCVWNEHTSIDVAPGAHTLETWVRMKGMPIKARKKKTPIEVKPGAVITALVTIGQYKTKVEVG